MIVSAEMKQVLAKEVNIGQVSIAAKKKVWRTIVDNERTPGKALFPTSSVRQCWTLLCGAENAVWWLLWVLKVDAKTKLKGNKQKITEQKQRLAAKGW